MRTVCSFVESEKYIKEVLGDMEYMSNDGSSVDVSHRALIRRADIDDGPWACIFRLQHASETAKWGDITSFLGLRVVFCDGF